MQGPSAHLHGHQLALLHDLLALLAQLAATLDLVAQQVTSRQVAVAILLHDLGALGALATAWASQHEDDVQVCRARQVACCQDEGLVMVMMMVMGCMQHALCVNGGWTMALCTAMC